MKILAVGDFHICGKNPVCRLDNLVEVQFTKLSEIISLANDLNCYIVQMGDLFDSPDVGHGIVSRTASIIKQLNSNLKFFTIWGQHDLLYHNLNTSNSTALGVLLNSEVIHHIKHFKGFDYVDWGNTFEYNEGEYFLSHKPVVVEEDLPFWMNNFFSFNILKKYYSIIFCGDWHKRYIHENYRTLLINPGAVTRREANEDSINTFPSVVLVDLETKKYKTIPLISAKPANEVISSEHLKLCKIQKSIKADIEKVIATIITRKDLKNDFKKLLIKALKDSKLETNVKEAIKNIMISTYGEKIEIE
jgi:DNA repair exonuclease SbcCD nuclease subunit